MEDVDGTMAGNGKRRGLGGLKVAWVSVRNATGTVKGGKFGRLMHPDRKVVQ